MRVHAELRRALVEITGRDVYKDYRNHIGRAKRRGLEMRMTFPEWVQTWGSDIANKGTRKGQMVMCRHRDKGHYEVGNVRIGTCSSNIHEYYRHKLEDDVKEAWSTEYGDQSANVDWIEVRRDTGYF